MAKLIYSNIASLDGYIEDEGGKFDWAMPSEELHAFENDLMRPLGTHLYGRRLYETMRYWEVDDPSFEQSPVYRDFASIWREADKIVYSTTLDQASTARTRIEREFDPEAVRALKESADRDLAIGGPGLASEGFGAGLVDEVHLVLMPVTVGDGKRALPEHLRLDLELLDERRFADGAVHLHYAVKH